MSTRAKILTLLTLAAALVLARYANAPNTAAAFLSLFAVIAQGYFLGPRWLPERGPLAAILWGSLGSLASLMLIRGAGFYAGLKLNAWGDAWTTVIMLALGCLWILLDRRALEPARQTTNDKRAITDQLLASLSVALSISGLLLIAWAAFRAGTADAIRTPWPLLPEWTLPLVGILWILALATAWRIKSAAVSAIQTACALGATLSIAPLFYRIGYGFDGFLHVAGEKVLLLTGTLLPKPPYYIGQYVFVTWLARLTDLDVALIDRWLVPVLAAILIPAALALVAGRGRATTLIALILMPLGAFVATTPHGFATVLAVIALLLCIPSSQFPVPNSQFLSLPFALWSALTHPLVGLPILCVTLMALAHAASDRRKPLRFVSWSLALAAGLVVPVVFGLASGLGSAAGVTFDLNNLGNADAWAATLRDFIPWVGNRYAIWPEASVWVEKLLPLIAILFALLAAWRARKTKTSFPPWLLAAASVAFSAIVLKLAGDFGFLIDYERGNYAERLWSVAWLLLLPLAIPELGRRLEDARRGAFVSVAGLLIAFGLLGAGASYAALPRHDAVTPSRGWSVSAADVDAVKLIDEDSGGRKYTVLANQSVSAAAVRTFGFKRYNGDVFFYPIPTGGALYQLYLRASYEDPSREVMREAGRLGGSDIVYFVLNDYWWKADVIGERALESADRSFVVQDGKVRVFKYDLTQPNKKPKDE